jgi:hypothetical protein
MKKANHIIAIIFFSLMLIFQSKGQERLGICNSVYAGINGVWINPAFIVNSPFKWDFNLISFHTYIDNNYVYMYKANIPALIRNNDKVINSHNEYNLRNNITSEIMVYDRYTKPNKNSFQSLLLQGPSLMLTFKKFSIGIICDVREGLSLTGSNYKLAKLAYEGMTYRDLMHQYIYVPKFRINAGAWAEIGVSGGAILKKKRNELVMKGGITYKYLIGYANAYVHNRSSTLHYSNDNDMDFYYLNADYGHALPQNKAVIIGTGQSVDLGFTIHRSEIKKLKNHYLFFYKKGSDCPGACKSDPYMLYRWRLGISLLDIGYVKCTRETKKYIFTNATDTWYGFSHWAPGGLDGVDKDFSTHFAGDTLATPNDTKYTSLMPMALSIQYDYNIEGDFYINYSLVQRLPHFNTAGIDRENLLSFTPRFDNAYFGVSLPVMLYQYMYPRVGLSFRIGNVLIIGTDKLGCLLNNKFSGMDFYFSIKLNALRKCE